MRSCSKTAVRELYFAKIFVRETVIKFSSCSFCLAKNVHFLDSCIKKIFEFGLVKTWKQQNLRVCGSAQTKNLRQKVEIFVFGIFLYRQNYEGTT